MDLQTILPGSYAEETNVIVSLLIWRDPPLQWAMASSFTRFLDHTQRRTTFSRTPLDEWSARRRDLYLTTHNTHNRKTSMPPVGFEPTISAGEWPQTYALDRAATGTGKRYLTTSKYFFLFPQLFGWPNNITSAPKCHWYSNIYLLKHVLNLNNF